MERKNLSFLSQNLLFRGAAEESAFRLSGNSPHTPAKTARKLSLLTLLALFASAFAAAQDLTPGAIYTCNGEHIFIGNCNMNDTSDAGRCMVGHPDHIQPNGLMQYTNATRADLKKLFATCTPPTAKNLEAAKAFQKKQQDTYNANAKRAEDQLNAPPPSAAAGGPNGVFGKPTSPEERQMNRCISSGRLPSSCTGNALLGGFSQLLGSVLPSATAHDADSGPVMAGVFEGPGHWRLDFIDGGVLVNCSDLAPKPGELPPQPRLRTPRTHHRNPSQAARPHPARERIHYRPGPPSSLTASSPPATPPAPPRPAAPAPAATTPQNG